MIDPGARRELSRLQVFRAVFMLLVGLGLGLGAAWAYYNSRSLPARATAVKAADLLRANGPDNLPEWISYTTSRSINTGVEYVKMRSRTTTSRFILVAVNDHWLLTKVSPQHSGGSFEGRLVGIDGVALSNVRTTCPDQVQHLLPYQLDADTELSGYQRTNTILGIASAVLGVLVFFSGARGLMARPPALRTTLPAPTKTVSPAPVPGTLPLSVTNTWLSSEKTNYASSTISQAEPAPRQRSLLLRAFVTVVWMVVLFVVSAFVIGLVSSLKARGDQQLANQLVRESSVKLAPLIVLGPIGVASILGYLGWLPGTRR